MRTLATLARSPSGLPCPAAWLAVLLALTATPWLVAARAVPPGPRAAFVSSGAREDKRAPAPTAPQRDSGEHRPPRPKQLPRQFKGLVPEVGPRPQVRRATA